MSNATNKPLTAEEIQNTALYLRQQHLKHSIDIDSFKPKDRGFIISAFESGAVCMANHISQPLHDKIKELEEDKEIYKEIHDEIRTSLGLIVNPSLQEAISKTNYSAVDKIEYIKSQLTEKDALLYKFYGLVNKLDKWSMYPKEEILEINQEYNNQKEK